MQIYVGRENGGFLLTDDGSILQDLELSGCRLDTPKRKELLALTLNGFGVQLREQKLQVLATTDDFPLRKHNLMQAMLAVNDLFYLCEPTVMSLFYEDVVAWLDANDVRFTPNAKFTGLSGYDHRFEFVIPKSRAYPERILQTINRPNKETAQSVAFAWLDTKEVRPEGSKAYAFLNDAERAVAAAVEQALRRYEVTPVPWSERDEVVAELTG
jgi:hypothetical protein